MADSILSQSSQDVLRSLDEQLKECAPLDECPGNQGHGLDYIVRMEEAKKVSITLCLEYRHQYPRLSAWSTDNSI